MIRKMGNFEVIQRTKDGFFNATALLKQWNNAVENQKVLNTQNSGYLKNSTENQQVLNTQNFPYVKKKDIDDFFLNKSTQEYIQVIIQKENLNTEASVYLKSRGKYSGGTWMHPMLFIDFAMWLNPYFKYDVLRFVSDEMIKYRNLAGDSYKTLASHVATIVPKPLMPMAMKKIAQGLNFIVFGDHKHAMRNEVGEETKQLELFQLQQKVADLIGDEFIKSFDELITYLRKLYGRKYTPKALIN
ncbi:KilA-N domain protein [Capnocytophaga sp. CM59]|nr:KilA-N domain protein [Capnocytophaga sp. CM59]